MKNKDLESRIRLASATIGAVTAGAVCIYGIYHSFDAMGNHLPVNVETISDYLNLAAYTSLFSSVGGLAGYIGGVIITKLPSTARYCWESFKENPGAIIGGAIGLGIGVSLSSGDPICSITSTLTGAAIGKSFDK